MSFVGSRVDWTQPRREPVWELLCPAAKTKSISNIKLAASSLLQGLHVAIRIKSRFLSETYSTDLYLLL